MTRIAIKIFFIACFLNVGLINAQSFVVQVKVMDDSIPVNYCNVTIKGVPYKFITNKNGKIHFSSAILTGKSFKIVISNASFAPFQEDYPVKPNNKTNDSLLITVDLLPRTIEDVTITFKPEIVYASKKMNVHDFDFIGDELILLTYEKRPGNNMRLVLASESNVDGEPLSSYLVNEDAEKLERDYEGKLHLVCKENVFLVTVYEKQIYILKESKEEYENFLKPLLTKTDEQIYFSNYAWHYPAFSYFAFRTTDSTYKTLKYVVDKFMLDMYRAEYKYVDTRMKLEAYRMQEKTGIDKEIWAAVWNGFPNSLYYKPVYAPMFLRNDTAFLFDHYSNFLYYFDETNKLTDSVAINYHLGKEAKDWKKQLLMDDITKKIYNIFERNGTYVLCEMDVKGRAVRTFNLQYKYPDKIKVHNGYVYFNYRPFESQQNKYLYKQVLN